MASSPSSLRRSVASSLPPSLPTYAELQVTTNFTFLTGASHPEEMVEQAAALGHRAVTITDRNSLAGVVRAHVAARSAGIPLAVGCRLDLARDHRTVVTTAASSSQSLGPSVPQSLSLLSFPTTRAAYGRLCRLLSLGKRRAPKGECFLSLHDLIEHGDGLLVVAVPPAVLDQGFLETLEGLKRVFGDDGDRLSLAVSRGYGPDDRGRLAQLAALSSAAGVPMAATNDVHYHVPERRALQDVLTCIRHGCTIGAAGLRLFPHAERHLKPAEVMAESFVEHPEALERSVEIAERAAAFSLDELRYEYPEEVCPPGVTPLRHLRDLTLRGACERYPGGVPGAVRERIGHELRLIGELAYAPYFLTVHDLVVFARSRGILCQGRGAAANSAVCYCLGVTAVDPDRIDLLFERFISKERDEPPDIDIDFEHERREEVIQYIYSKYGRDRAALTAEVITYRGRSAVREVGKALGLSLDCVDRLAKSIDWWHDGVGDARYVRDAGLDPDDPVILRLRALAHELLGFPRHLSQHVGGFVITRTPLCELVPIENAAMPDRTVIEWDKDDIDAMGMLKVDVLGLGMLTCIRKALSLVNEERGTKGQRDKGTGNRIAITDHEPGAQGAVKPPTTADSRPLSPLVPQSLGPSPPPPLALHTIPPEDRSVYDMICAADTVGVFQIESRAQMSMLPRLRPRCFYDLVIEVAIVRPGPIQGDMVHPYLRRRNGEEMVSYPDERVRKVLGKTLGVPLFQEQAMALAIVGAGFTPGEADRLRRAMAAWKRKGDEIERFGARLVRGMIERGYEREFAERCFRQIRGFSEYGFPESHAASFALLVYVSAWLKKHYPAAFAAALINSQPMGFYAPAQIIRDARDHGVTVVPVDVNGSGWDCTLEEGMREKGNEGKRGEGRAHPHSLTASFPHCLRLGLRLVKGLRQEDGEAVADAVAREGSFDSVAALWRASGVGVAALRRLARADAFGSMGLDRQQALWALRALRDETLPMFEAGMDEDRAGARRRGSEPAPAAALPPIPLPVQVVQDYGAISLSLKAHPISFLREALEKRGVTKAERLKDGAAWPNGRRVAVGGLVLVRQRPSTAKGIVFMTIEDETGIANLIVRPEIYRRYRRIARHGVAIVARGVIERQGEVVHVMVRRLEALDEMLMELTSRSRDFR